MGQSEDDIRDAAFRGGQRAALRSLLAHCLRELGYDGDYRYEYLIEERERAVAALRQICDDYGDNAWPDHQPLDDILEHHLRDYLDVARWEREETED